MSTREFIARLVLYVLVPYIEKALWLEIVCCLMNISRSLCQMSRVDSNLVWPMMKVLTINLAKIECQQAFYGLYEDHSYD